MNAFIKDVNAITELKKIIYPEAHDAVELVFMAGSEIINDVIYKDIPPNNCWKAELTSGEDWIFFLFW